MAEPVARTESIRKVYGSTVALDDVHLRVEAGSVYGLVGPNGAGKSTLIGLVAGLRRPTAGSVHLGVQRRRMSVMPDTPRFDTWLTAAEVVDLARTMVAPELPAPGVSHDDVPAGAMLAGTSPGPSTSRSRSRSSPSRPGCPGAWSARRG